MEVQIRFSHKKTSRASGGTWRCAAMRSWEKFGSLKYKKTVHTMQHKEARGLHKHDGQPLQGAFVCSHILREIPSKILPGYKKVLNTKCVFWFSVQHLSETFYFLWRIERDVNNAVYRAAFEVAAVLGRFKLHLNFLHRFYKNGQISNFMKNREEGAELLNGHRRTDCRTDMMKLTVTIGNFENAPKSIKKM